ncbi:hypothetical protein NUH87_31010 [Pseudomonas batumici]|uniref:hypothetical protein n=1 Tax=Pseudomonas batumici TaxID=226910 RepID=UPI0030CE8ECB
MSFPLLKTVLSGGSVLGDRQGPEALTSLTDRLQSRTPGQPGAQAYRPNRYDDPWMNSLVEQLDKAATFPEYPRPLPNPAKTDFISAAAERMANVMRSISSYSEAEIAKAKEDFTLAMEMAPEGALARLKEENDRADELINDIVMQWFIQRIFYPVDESQSIFKPIEF